MPYQEFEAMLGLIGRVVFDARTGALMLLLLIAAICDYRTHRISNCLVLCGLVYGAICTTLAPPVVHGTALFPVWGMLLGLLLFLPLYLLRVMGAGDVKLLAMVGAFLGPVATFYAALASIVVGGVLSIVWVLARGTMRRMVQNLTMVFRLALLDVMSGSLASLRIAPEASAGKLPYGIAIAIGTIGYLFVHQLGLL